MEEQREREEGGRERGRRGGEGEERGEGREGGIVGRKRRKEKRQKGEEGRGRGEAGGGGNERIWFASPLCVVDSRRPLCLGTDLHYSAAREREREGERKGRGQIVKGEKGEIR